MSNPDATTWNYRLMRHRDAPQDYFAVHEVYYDGNTIRSWTERPTTFGGSSLREVLMSLQDAARDLLRYPAIDAETGEEVEYPSELGDY